MRGSRLEPALRAGIGSFVLRESVTLLAGIALRRSGFLNRPPLSFSAPTTTHRACQAAGTESRLGLRDQFRQDERITERKIGRRAYVLPGEPRNRTTTRGPARLKRIVHGSETLPPSRTKRVAAGGKGNRDVRFAWRTRVKGSSCLNAYSPVGPTKFETYAEIFGYRQTGE
jgi:hypothetical protein